MNKNQRELRRTAAKKFNQSLEQLEFILQPDTSSSKNSSPENSSPEKRGETSYPASLLAPPIPTEEIAVDSLASDPAFDQIVEDIDRFIEAKQPE